MKKIVDRLFLMQDLKLRDFNAKLIPNVNKENIIGIRTPDLRNYAKELVNDKDIEIFLNELPHKYLEENTLHGMIIAIISKDIYVTLDYLDKFLPYVDNWATCDVICPKIFKKYEDIVYEKIKIWLKSKDTYVVRFAIISLLQFYLDDNFKDEILDLIIEIDSDEYYINMAIAWFFSFALIKQYDVTIPIFENKRLKPWIHNKSLQKARESYRISLLQKEYFNKLKIKNK